MKKLIVTLLFFIQGCSVLPKSIDSEYIKDIHLEAGEEYKRSNYHRAIELWEVVVSKDPSHIEAWTNIGVVQKTYLNNLALADETISRAISINKKSSSLISFLGVIKIDQGLIEEGLTLHQDAKAISPKDIDILHSLAMACHKVKDYNCAVQNFTEILKINPEKSNLHFNIGLAYMEQGRFSDAIEAFDKAIERSPLNSEAYGKKGDAYLALQRVDEAIDSYKEAIEIEPDLAWVIYNLGVLYHDRDADKAKSYYESYIKIDSENPNAWTNLGLIQLKQGDLNKALKSQRKAVEYGNGFPNFHHNLGLVWYRKKCPQKALEELTFVAEKHPAFIHSQRLIVKIAKENNLTTEEDVDRFMNEESAICKSFDLE